MDVKTAAGIAGAGVTTINAIWVAGARLSIAQTFEASAAGLGLRAPFALGDNDGSRPHGGDVRANGAGGLAAHAGNSEALCVLCGISAGSALRLNVCGAAMLGHSPPATASLAFAKLGRVAAVESWSSHPPLPSPGGAGVS